MSALVINGVVDLIGNTPLVPLRVLTSELPDSVRVYVKAEWMNPGGSVKDRAARSIVARAWESGELSLVASSDASSGNTGIAYAMLAAALGFKLKLCLPANANPERKRTLIAYGAERFSPIPPRAQMVPSSKRKLSAVNLLGLRRPIQQRCKLAGPLQHDRSRVGKADRGQAHALRRRTGNERYMHGVGRYLREFLPAADLIAGSTRWSLSRLRGHEAHGISHCPGDL